MDPPNVRAGELVHDAPYGQARGAHLQKKAFRATEQTRPDVEELRRQFLEEVEEIAPGDLVFLDEAGCNTTLAPRCAWAPRGQRAPDNRPANRGKNISMIGAIRVDDILALEPVEGAVNGPTFEDFVERHLVPKLRATDVVVMDNVRFHKGSRVRELIEETGAQLWFLPPYSPQLNPIELFWSAFKARLRRLRARTQDALFDAIRATGAEMFSDFAPMYASCNYA